MVVLRSREIQAAQSIPKPLTECSTPEPVAPAQINEPSNQSPLTLNLEHDHSPPNSVSCSQSNRRWSLRLASKKVPDGDCVQNGPRKRKRAGSLSEEERNFDSHAIGDVAGNSMVFLGTRSGKRIVKMGLECSGDKSVVDIESGECGGDRSVNKSVIDIGEELEEKDSSREGNGSHNEIRGNVYAVENMSGLHDGGMSGQVSPVNKKLKENVEDCDNSRGTEKIKMELTEKRDQETVATENHEENQITNGSNNTGSSRRYTREDKGKEKLVDGDSASNIIEMAQLELESQIEGLRAKIKEFSDSLKDALDNGKEANNSNSRKSETRMERFRDIARKNASRFAHFEPPEQQADNSSPPIDVEMPSAVVGEPVEDWPGPFSTAMKIIRDRENKLNSQQGPSASTGAKSVPITWIPRKNRRSDLSRAPAPSLLNLCMEILVKNVDAVASLGHVPDALRHRLCQLLCDCRRMNSHFLELLLQGSPTEIRIKDCSWLTEEEFTKCFGACDTSNLLVLQLDQCGRCIADYLLHDTLARSSSSMPALITLSLRGACRLTDIGLGSLVSAAPALRSINLSQCSLLTSLGIGTVAKSLGSNLQELYLDDCQILDVMLILPALKKLEHLEVLSLAGIQAVSDKFMQEFVSARGYNMKEIVLANCTNLTDFSIKVIAETCPSLCSLDLVNLPKLTDAALVYLANSFQKIQALKFCRNNFSDEAIAAFLETSGEPLTELSLNNVAKVGNNTALALARRSRNLVKLDISWCRNLTTEAVGLIVDSCTSLRVLKVFGCGQITNVLLDGHSNEVVEIIGLKLTPVFEHVRVPDSEEFPLRYTSASFFRNVK